jgi:hypothetical protein
MDAIRAEGAAGVAKLRQANQTVLAALRDAGERRLEEAAGVYAAIVKGRP